MPGQFCANRRRSKRQRSLGRVQCAVRRIFNYSNGHYKWYRYIYTIYQFLPIILQLLTCKLQKEGFPDISAGMAVALIKTAIAVTTLSFLISCKDNLFQIFIRVIYFYKISTFNNKANPSSIGIIRWCSS
jgi:hypothetical protein